MKVQNLRLGGTTPAYIQCPDLARVLRLQLDLPVAERMNGATVTGALLETRDGDVWNNDPAGTDAKAGATRTEIRTEDEIPNGVTVTRVYVRELLPETYPLYGHGQDNLKQTLGQGFCTRMNVPLWFSRLEGDRESILLNSYADDGAHAFEVLYPFRYGSRRWVVTECYYDDGTGDLGIWCDGVQLLDLKRYPFAEKGKLGGQIIKLGIYLRKGEGNLTNGAPTFRAGYWGYKQYEGAAKAADIGPVVTPFEPVRVKVGQGAALPVLPQVGAAQPAPVPTPADPKPAPVEPAPKPSPAPAPAPGPVEPVPNGNELPHPEAAVLCAALEGVAKLVDGLVPLTAAAFPKEDDDVARVARYARQAAERIRARAPQ